MTESGNSTFTQNYETRMQKLSKNPLYRFVFLSHNDNIPTLLPICAKLFQTSQKDTFLCDKKVENSVFDLAYMKEKTSHPFLRLYFSKISCNSTKGYLF